ncbi:MAG: amino acid-binding protein [Clostridia bacterium]|nr:amino acid-binding protein [Clostridia bacterium]
MAVEQLSIFVENAPGRLANITEILANANIDMKAVSVADTADFGIFRMIVSDTQGGYDILKKNNITSKITEVLAVKILDGVGSLNQVLQLLSKADVNIEYLYSLLSHDPKNAYIIMRVDDTGIAKNILIENNIEVVDKLDL